MPAVWSCSKCHTPLGHLIGGDTLIITGNGTLVERTRSTVLVHCPGCAKAITFSGRRVIFNMSTMTVARSGTIGTTT